jgi:hypothetical protein
VDTFRPNKSLQNFKWTLSLVNKGIKAMYEVLRKGRIHNLSIKCQLDLFDKIIKPILLYGCEICGFGKSDIIERVDHSKKPEL